MGHGSISHKYAHNFSWMGRPILQVPQDVYAIQELVWTVKPDLIIETGIAHGGSLVLSASLLALLDYCDAVAGVKPLDIEKPSRKVLGIDIEIRPHNRKALDEHPMRRYIEMLEGSSVAPEIADKVRARAADFNRVMVFLDSNHTHDHVLGELLAYAPLVSPGSYCVVWDTGVEDLPAEMVADRPWGKGNSPKSAAFAYLDMLKDGKILASDGLPLSFEIDKMIEYKIAITAANDGFLKRV